MEVEWTSCKCDVLNRCENGLGKKKNCFAGVVGMGDLESCLENPRSITNPRNNTPVQPVPHCILLLLDLSLARRLTRRHHFDDSSPAPPGILAR
jgi:hypothetical protein